MSESYNINLILECLKNTYSSPDKKVRAKSEEKLAELKNQNIVDFSSQLTTLLKSNEIDKNMKISIILYLKRSLKEKIDKNEIDKIQCGQLIQQLIIILVYPSLTKKQLENLSEVFGLLLDMSPEETLLEIIKYINNQRDSMPLGSFNGVISILNSIISSKSLTKKYFSEILNISMGMGYTMIENLFSEYEKLNLNTNLEDFLKLNDMFSNSFDFFFMGNFKSSKRFQIKDEKMDNLFFKIYILGLKLLVNMKSINNNKIISWTDQENIDKNINTMKINIFRFINLQLNNFGEIIIDENKINVSDQLIKIILSELGWIIMNKYSILMKLETEDEQNFYSDYNYSLLISYMFIYLKRSLGKDNFIKEYTKQFNDIFKNALLPLLILSKLDEEIALDNDSVNGYCIDIDDVINGNKQKKIKSTVAGLIKVFYKKNEICKDFLFKYTVGLLEFLISGNNNILSNKEYFNENDIIIVLLKAYSKEKIATTLFLLLNILADINPDKNKTNDAYLRDFFSRIFDACFKIDNVLLKHQIILFISNYALRFFESDSDAFESQILFLYNCLFDTKSSLISNSASEEIQHFFEKKSEDENIKSTLLKAAIKNINNFENHIANIQISNFFDVLYQIFINFEKYDNDFFIQIFAKICKRINVEEERHRRLKFKVKKEKNKIKKKAAEQTNLNDYKIIVNKCFNIIRMLMHSKIFVVKNLPKIEESLAPLVEYMNEPSKIDFDEDIVEIINNLIIHNQHLTKLSLVVIEHLYKYCKKIEGLLLDMYELINAYLAYGTDVILSNEKYMEGIYKVFEQGLKNDKFKNGPFFTCLLIQTWVINCPKIPQTIVQNIANIIFKDIGNILNDYKTNRSLGEDNYNFLGGVTVILSSLINYSNIIIPYLSQINNGNALKQWLGIINEEDEPGFEYEIKIIIYSISMVIQRGIIKNDINDLLNLSIELLKSQEYNAKYELRKNNKKNLNINFQEDEQSEDDKDEDSEDNDYDEIKDLLAKTINPIKDMDEFKIFNELLLYLKNNNNAVYSNWESTLDDKKKSLVNKLFATKRINISTNDNNNVKVPRRILTIKRSSNSSSDQ